MKTLNYLLLLFSLITYSQTNFDLSYFLKNHKSYNQSIPKPSEFTLGNMEVGNSHISHDRLVQYMSALANASERITITNRGETFEGRPLILLTITSEENHKNLESVRTNHLDINSTKTIVDFSKMPVVVYQGYSIHGNEPSGSNAAMLYAYHLAASNDNELLKALEKSIILLDPSMNPDGLQRFAHWVNTNKSYNLNPDNNDREFDENWPKGRTNHYWFDMNRDWLPVQLPESEARIKTFHNWSPNILTDHHEMGTNSTFFFQPGIPSRVNPLTPKKNQLLTKEIGKFHDKRLSEIGSLFYSEEDYDDFYFGKGSTFPDINGAVGILFEQGSSRGHLQESINGLLSFPFTIKNQLTVSLSTLEAAVEMRETLLAYQNDFFKNTREESLKEKNNYYLVTDQRDKSKLFEFYKILEKHQILMKKLPEDVIINKTSYSTNNSILIPKNQNKTRLIKAMFEKRKKFKDSLFYDVSAWSFLHSFNLDYTNYSTKINTKNLVLNKPIGKIINKNNYAYLFSWDDYYSPKILYKLLELGLRVKVGTQPFYIDTKRYDYGTLLISLVNQKISTTEINNQLDKLSKESGVEFVGYNSSTTKGIDFGSNDFINVSKPKIAMIVGDGVTSYDAGEIWHLLDTRYNIPLTKIKKSNFSNQNLEKYNTIIMVNGKYDFDEKNSNKLKKWVENGGNLIGYRNSINWLIKKDFIKLELKQNKASTTYLNHKDKSNHFGSQLTSGAIFSIDLDKSHPISYGYNNSLSIFRNTNIYIKNDTLGYNNPLKYSKNPLISGYISKENLQSMKNSRPFAVYNLRKGKVTVFTDNTNFRAFWHGTNKLMMNAIFFSNLM
ncbi:MAG: M14 family metallopeptidase [Flavobacteriaceae bacterium]|nr:M14 family metallopeptidase [Flavobacteriaceae bacterium]